MCEATLSCPHCGSMVSDQEEISCYRVGTTYSRRYICTCGIEIMVEAKTPVPI